MADLTARRAPRRARLDVPAEQRRTLRPHYDPDAFGKLSEQIARFLGTAKFLVYMTIFILLWVIVNVTPLAFDPYTFTFLTLLLSLQASYAAPLILLAQNRQADRDRVSLDEDRGQNARLMAEVEYLSRELAALRQAVGEVTTRDFLREQLREVTEEVIGRGRQDAAGDEQVGAEPFDEARRLEREDRKRRAERKRRAKQKRADDSAASTASLGEPFVGEGTER